VFWAKVADHGSTVDLKAYLASASALCWNPLSGHVKYRELRSFIRRVSRQQCELPGEVVPGRTKIVSNLANGDAPIKTEFRRLLLMNSVHMMPRLGLNLCTEGLVIGRAAESFLCPPERRNFSFCTRDLEARAAKRMGVCRFDQLPSSICSTRETLHVCATSLCGLTGSEL
jgi:hypothetical protein